MSYHIHERIFRSMSLVTAAALFAGYLGGRNGLGGLLVGMGVMTVVGRLAFWYLPSAETIAVQWQDREMK